MVLYAVAVALAHAAVLTATAVIAWTTAVLDRVILTHALGPLQARWTAYADPMQMAGLAIT